MDEQGPIEDGEWAPALEAHVVDAGPPPRVHGYDVWNDLARNYGFAEVVLLSLRGVAPTAAEGRAFDLALTLLAPASIAEAPAHTTALLRMMAAPPANTVGVGAMSLAQQAQALVEAHASWFAWLANPIGEPPNEFLARTPEDRTCVAAVRAVVDEDLSPVLARIEPTADATALALLVACGVRSAHQVIGTIVLARLALVVAEADRHVVSGLRHYPIELPAFDYEEDERG